MGFDKKPINYDISMLACMLMGLVYIFLPSINNTIDSLSFATSVRDGEELFKPHHLLYNALGYILTHPFHIRNTLAFLCLMNAVVGMGCLWMMRSMLLNFTDKKTTGLLILFIGICYGFVRFTTDAETYIIPLFFALWGSRTILVQKKVFQTSLLVSIACLFHQIYFFWWIGLMILVLSHYRADWVKKCMLYCATALVVPLVYFIVFYTTKTDSNHLLGYVFHDYIQYDYVDISFKKTTLILAPVSFIRTFIQVHGYFLPLLKKQIWLCIPIVVSLILVLAGCFHLRKCIEKRRSTLFENKFASAHILIFILQFLFAVFSDGNAEFMYMLPFAGILFLFLKFRIKIQPVFYFTTAMFLWNFFLALYPYHFMQLSSDKSMADYMSQNNRKVYYLQNRSRIDNLMNYYYPEQSFQSFPAEYKVNLDSLISAENSILTNTIDNKSFLSRASFVSEINKEIIQHYQAEKIDSIPYDLGILNIVRLNKKGCQAPPDNLLP